MTSAAPAGSDATARAAAIELAGITFSVGNVTPLSNIDLTIPGGQRVALIGPSGAGKTTLLRLIAGLIWPTWGTLRVLGRDPAALRGRALRELRQQIGFLHQQDNLVPGLRVAHNVLMGRLGRWSTLKALWSLLRPQDLEAAHTALQRVELGNRLWAMPGELSGGEQQRVAIARLLLLEPQLLLADEPVSALDIRLGREVVRLLLEIAAQDVTTVVSLHSLDLLREGFDRVVALRSGRIAFDGTPAELRRGDLASIYGAEYRALNLDELEL